MFSGTTQIKKGININDHYASFGHQGVRTYKLQVDNEEKPINISINGKVNWGKYQ